VFYSVLSNYVCYQFNHVGYNNAVIIAVSLGLRNNSHIFTFPLQCNNGSGITLTWQHPAVGQWARGEVWVALLNQNIVDANVYIFISF